MISGEECTLAEMREARRCDKPRLELSADVGMEHPDRFEVVRSNGVRFALALDQPVQLQAPHSLFCAWRGSHMKPTYWCIYNAMPGLWNKTCTGVRAREGREML